MIWSSLRSILLCAASAATALSSCTDAMPLPPRADKPEAQTAYFALHSDPWINLHHFLYVWAETDAGVTSGRPPVVERLELDDLEPAKRERWVEALGIYRDRIIARAGKSQLATLREQLIDWGAADDGAVFEALTLAMPLFAERWWPRHHAANARWIAAVAPLLVRDEAGFVDMTRRLFGAEWGDDPWRVDISTYSPLLAYATPEGRVVIHGADPANSELSGVEVIFHEMQHIAPIVGTLPTQLQNAFSEAGIAPPAEIGHALIYLTAGEHVRAAASARSEEHVPFWVSEGFAELPQWRPFATPIQTFWLLAVRGDLTAAQSLQRIVEALSH